MKTQLSFVCALLLATASVEAATFSRFGLSPVAPFGCAGSTEGASYENTTSHQVFVCNGTAWTLMGGVGGSGTINTVPKFTAATTLGNSSITDNGTIVVINGSTTDRATVPSDGSGSFSTISGTLPAVTTGQVVGKKVSITSAGSSANQQVGTYTSLLAGYTGPSGTFGLIGQSGALGAGVLPFIDQSNKANYGTAGFSTGGGTGTNIGTYGEARSAPINYGGFFEAVAVTTSNVGIGVAGFGKINTGTQVGGFFGLASSTSTMPTYQSAALIADNETETDPIFLARDNGSVVFGVYDGGDVRLARTITAIGTTGNQTINKAAGTINIAAGAASVDLTNSLVTVDTIALASLAVADGTCTFIKSIVPTSSHLVFTLNANCTATQSIRWIVTN